MGRVPDGGTDWAFFSMPTPGYSNLRTDLPEEPVRSEELRLWPNPVFDGVVYFSRTTSGRVYAISGSAILQIRDSQWMNVEGLAPGIYLFRPAQGEPLRFIIGGN